MLAASISIALVSLESTHKEDLCARVAYGVERAVHELGSETG